MLPIQRLFTQASAGLLLLASITAGNASATPFQESDAGGRGARRERPAKPERQRGSQERAGAQRGQAGENARFGAALIEIGRAVESGRMTPAQALARIDGLKARMGGGKKGQARAEEERQVWEKIQASVKAGKLTKKQGEQRMKAWKERSQDAASDKPARGGDAAPADQRLQNAKAKLEQAVRNGRITREEMNKRLVAMKKQVKQPAKGDRKTDRKTDRKSPQTDVAPAKVRAKYDAMAKKIQAAVKDGILSQQEADRKLAEFRKKLGGQKKRQER